MIPSAAFFLTRGVALSVPDIVSWEWPERAASAGLNTITTHGSIVDITDFLKSENGEAFLKKCEGLGLQVEHELHAVSRLLPRDLFAKDPAMFRMDHQGARVQEWNLCVHSKDALDIACENAATYARILRPATGRYFFWIDDGKPMCKCPKCRELSDADQALILANRLIETLRELNPKASLAHLAYLNTLQPPRHIRPKSGIFLEFAPIRRRYDVPFCRREMRSGPIHPSHGEQLDALEENLKVFGYENAQALEYWLDESRFAGWKRDNLMRIPWNREVFLDDLRTYSKYGIRHVTSFAVWVDGDYVKRFGEPPIQEYGAALLSFKAKPPRHLSRHSP